MEQSCWLRGFLKIRLSDDAGSLCFGANDLQVVRFALFQVDRIRVVIARHSPPLLSVFQFH